MSTTLNDIKITISLEEYFNLSYYRHLSNIMTISEERYNILSTQEGFKELVHSDSFVSDAGKTLYRIQRMENIAKSSVEKDKERELTLFQHNLAKQKSTVIEEWKKASLYKLMKTGQLNKEQSLSIIQRAMNPTTERDKKFAEKLNYPYRDDCHVVSEEKANELDPNVKVSESSLTYKPNN